jgi:uncharacterized Zn-binding protein involved in type VI secretion
MGATVMCSHAGQATCTSPSPVVSISGQPIATIASPYVIAGCTFVPPAGDGPCVTSQWITGATQVFSQGQPVAVSTGAALCVPTGTPLMVAAVQATVLAT